LLHFIFWSTCNCATVVTFIFLINILFLFILTHLFTVVFLYDGLPCWLKWCIQRVLCWNLGQGASYQDWCSLWVASIIPGKCQDISLVRYNHFLFEQTNFKVRETQNIQSIRCGLWTFAFCTCTLQQGMLQYNLIL
jgi:hypothetical protein